MGVAHQPREGFLPQPCLIRLVIDANRAGADADEGNLQVGLAEAHLVGRILDCRINDERGGLAGSVGLQSATRQHACAKRSGCRERDKVAAAQFIHVPSSDSDDLPSA